MNSNSLHGVVCFGEILWDILPTAALPGGAPMNVAYHLQKLGKNPALITRIGLDNLGKELVNLLSIQGVCTEYFQIDYDHPTGKVYAKPNEHNEVVYDIVYPAAWDNISCDNGFIDLLQDAEYFVFGSLITRNAGSRNTLYKLIEAAKIKVLDINLRAPYFTRQLVEDLLHKVDILKLNLAELELITGWFNNFDDETDRIKLLKDRFNLETVIVTKGAGGAILNIGSAYFKHKGYVVNVADTIGSGDAFLAAVISKLIDKCPPEEILDYGCAVGALIASYPGGCPDYDINEISELTKTTEAKMIFAFNKN